MATPEELLVSIKKADSGIPRKYQRGSRRIISYDWVDLEEGSGIVVYYAGGIRDSVGVSYRLDRNVFATSDTAATTKDNVGYIGGGDAAFTKRGDYDFDTAIFNTPRIIKGTAMANVAYALTNSAGGSTSSAYCIVKYIHVDAVAAETVLVTTQSNTITATAAVPVNDAKFAFESVIPQTLFKRGEKLRITLEHWGMRSAGVNSWLVTAAFSPLNLAIPANGAWKAISTGFSQTSFQVPFKI